MMVFRRLYSIRAVELIRGTYAIVPLLIWAALRFEQRGITAALLLVAVIAVTAHRRRRAAISRRARPTNAC